MPASKTAPPPTDFDSASRRHPRVDAYIADAAPFARPILAHLRHVVHDVCPEAVETMKWSMPFFTYRDANLCHMAAFKAHCVFGFWREKEIDGIPSADSEAAGCLGRVESLDDVPGKRDLTRWIKAAMKLTDGGTKPLRMRTAAAPKAAPVTPDDLAAAIGANSDAKRHYDAFGPGAKREYVAWIEEAKREATRAQRIATAVEWIAEGKQRNWKYQSC